MNPRFAFAVATALFLLAPAATHAQPVSPDYYVGLGIRTGLYDSTALVIDSRITLARVEPWTASLRPTLLLAGAPELRVAATIDYVIEDRVVPYAGAGIAWNESGSARTDPMLAAGLDWVLVGPLVLDLNLNHLFQPNDTDTEFTASLNYSLSRVFR